MFKTKHFFIAAMAMLALSGAAQAGVITSSETANEATNRNKPYEFTYDVSGAKDFKANTNFFTSANLGITMSGDNGKQYKFKLGHEETFWFVTWFKDAQEVVYDGLGAVTQNFGFNSTALADLNADGKISIYFKPDFVLFGKNDTMKIDSTLTANFTDPAVIVTPDGGSDGEVPEPTSIALLGLGLLGMTQMRKRKA